MATTKIVIQQGDDNTLGVKLYTQQAEGIYELVPEEGSSVTFYIRDCHNEIVQETNIPVTAETESIEIKVSSTLLSGYYKYTLFYNYADGELHTLISDGDLVIEK